MVADSLSSSAGITQAHPFMPVEHLDWEGEHNRMNVGNDQWAMKE